MSEWRTDLAFAPVPVWVVELPISDRALRLYVLLAGMRDYTTDEASYGRTLLAKKLGCSVDTVDRAKAELEKHGAISVEREPKKRNVYTIHRLPPTSRTGAASRMDAATQLAAGVRPETSRNGAAQVEKKNQDEMDLPSLGEPAKAWNGPKQVGGKQVTAQESAAAQQILAAFNERSGKRFSGKEWLADIVRRIREHPDVSLERHQKIIDQQFARPWWKDDPTPSVIYGNGRVFDRALNGSQGPAKREPKYTRPNNA